MAAGSLAALRTADTGRAGLDRLELLTALIDGPSFDALYRPDVIQIPGDHPIYPWECVVGDCERTRTSGRDLCHEHDRLWREARGGGAGKAAFLTAAQGLGQFAWREEVACRICLLRPAASTRWRLCQRHAGRWQNQRKAGAADFGLWLTGEVPFGGHGGCQVTTCPNMAATPLGLCPGHETRYRYHGRPGGASLPGSWSRRFEQPGRPVPVGYRGEPEFRAWCAQEPPIPWPGQVNLRGLRPLVRAEIKWALFAHTRQPRQPRWDLGSIHRLAGQCRDQDASSLADLDLAAVPAPYARMARLMLQYLRLVYFTTEASKAAGFLETDHFGVRFPHRASHIDLTAITQPWLRDMVWDHLAEALRSVRRPRTAAPLDAIRKACTELSAFLETGAPGGGHDPAALRAGHAERFIADQQHRERHGLASLVMKGGDGKPSIVTATTRAAVLNGVRTVLRGAMDTGAAERLGLRREFITAVPAAGGTPRRARRPFPDEVARALADDVNLARLAADHDPDDQGMRDIWETLVSTGRRVNEILRLRLDCTGRYGGLPVLWHDQTKVGNLDAAIRIPERIYQVLARRQAKTADRFTARHGRRPAGAERATLALFPSPRRNPDGTNALGYTWFCKRFRRWVDGLDLGRYVAHQARHTLATNLLRNGATLSHVRRYLGHLSEKMAEHYIHLTSSDLEDVLHAVWVAGPGAASPGQLLTSSAAPMTSEQAQALAIDLSRRSTPAEGGFCTFQPVVDGGACPWNLNCHSCDKFVMSGADLLYWRRKREQWGSIAERAPDDATADYLHQVFTPTAAAIDGLEAALAGLGLLDQALALDLRRPQDYFQRIWSLGFRAADLTGTGDTEAPGATA
ncbi:MAG: tyrosine-type recombinase/integrase [Streptosporangiaceae bacterium]